MSIINQVVKGGGTTPTGKYIGFTVNANGELVHDSITPVMDFSGVQYINAEYLLTNTYANRSNIVGMVDLSDIVEITGAYACQSLFSACSNITRADLSSLRKATGYSVTSMFSECRGLTSVDLSSVEHIQGASSMFYNCQALQSISIQNLISLQEAWGMFTNCLALTNIDLSSLVYTTEIGDLFSYSGLTSINISSLAYTTTMSGAFQGCSGLTALSFNSFTPASIDVDAYGTSVLDRMCNGIPNITIHFPTNTQTLIESLDGYSTTAPFGATSGSVLFDLPATYAVKTTVGACMFRAPSLDTASALGWAYGDLKLYTSGTSRPTVGDAIYLDENCTTPWYYSVSEIVE